MQTRYLRQIGQMFPWSTSKSERWLPTCCWRSKCTSNQPTTSLSSSLSTVCWENCQPCQKTSCTIYRWYWNHEEQTRTPYGESFDECMYTVTKQLNSVLVLLAVFCFFCGPQYLELRCLMLWTQLVLVQMVVSSRRSLLHISLISACELQNISIQTYKVIVPVKGCSELVSSNSGVYVEGVPVSSLSAIMWIACKI